MLGVFVSPQEFLKGILGKWFYKMMHQLNEGKEKSPLSSKRYVFLYNETALSKKKKKKSVQNFRQQNYFSGLVKRKSCFGLKCQLYVCFIYKM